jgi:tetratricopeptide (TPR) repeat protein
MKINAIGLLRFCLFVTGLSILGIFIPAVVTVNSSLSLSSHALVQNTSLADISILNDKAKSLGNLGNYTEAIKYYDKALRIDPDNTEALHGKGLSLGTSGNHTEAIKYYDKVLRIDPDNMDALTGMGIILYNLGNHKGSMSFFNKVLTVNSTTKNVLFDKDVSLYGLKNYAGAIKYFDKALETDPNNTLLLNNQGFTLDISVTILKP